MNFVKINNIWLAGVLSAFVIGCGGSSSPVGGDQNQTDINVSHSQSDLVSKFLYFNNEDLASMGKDVVKGATLTKDFNGRDNMAYEFDGNSSAIEIPHNDKFNIQDSITLSAWVYASEKRSAVIIRKGAAVNGNERSPYELAISATGDAIFSLNLPVNGDEDNRTWVQLRTRYTSGVWFHMAGTYDGASMKLYIDGNLENAQDITGRMNTNQSPLLIGTRLRLPSSTLKGKIADIHIYNKALSSDEISNLIAE